MLGMDQLTPAALFATLVVGILGLAIFNYGRKQTRAPQIVAGVALMALPWGITGAAALLGVAGGIVTVLWLAVRFGA